MFGRGPKNDEHLDRQWRVRRRWWPWKRRIRDVPDVPGGDIGLGDDPISAIIGLVLLTLAIPAIVVILLLLAELLLLLLLVPVFALVRLALPVPWTIEVWWRPGNRLYFGWVEAYEEPATGWSASRARIAQLRAVTDGLGRGDRFVPPALPDGEAAPGRMVHAHDRRGDASPAGATDRATRD